MEQDHARLAIARHQLRICVFCGSSMVRTQYLEEAARLGREIAQRGHELVYGGAAIGMMGALASAAVGAGGRVVGVLPSVLAGNNIAEEALDDLVVVDTIADRKAVLLERSDCFVVLPGGVGTLDELSEVLVLNHLGMSATSIAVVNAHGFYDPLAAMLDTMRQNGFVDDATTARISFHDDVGAALDHLERLSASTDLEFAVDLDEPMLGVWEALTDPAKTVQWLFGTSFECSLEAGAPYVYRSANGKPALSGTVTIVEPPGLLEMTFSAVHSDTLSGEPASVLRWRLSPRGVGTALQLRHSALDHSPLTASRAAADWPIALRELAASCAPINDGHA